VISAVWEFKFKFIIYT